MSEIHSGNETKAMVKLCPQCGGAAVDVLSHVLLGPEKDKAATCSSCRWVGSADQLVLAPFKHEMGTEEQVIQSMLADLRNVLAKHFAKPFGSFLMKWGFISAGVTPKELSLYIVAMAKAIIVSMLEVRRQIEKDKLG